jgi:hypothetical protein
VPRFADAVAAVVKFNPFEKLVRLGQKLRANATKFMVVFDKARSLRFYNRVLIGANRPTVAAMVGAGLDD